MPTVEIKTLPAKEIRIRVNYATAVAVETAINREKAIIRLRHKEGHYSDRERAIRERNLQQTLGVILDDLKEAMGL